MFKVGDIVTCKNYGMYTYTDKDVMCEVVYANDTRIKVKIMNNEQNNIILLKRCNRYIDDFSDHTFTLPSMDFMLYGRNINNDEINNMFMALIEEMND